MKPNIVVLLLDTARRDRVSCYSSDEIETTPFIDSLAADGMKYEQAYSNSIWSLPAYASLFTGELPTEHGAVDWGKKIQKNTLVEGLNNKGYWTHSVSPHIVSGDFNIQQAFKSSEWVRKPNQDPPFEDDPALEKVQDERRAGKLTSNMEKGKSLLKYMIRERSWKTIPNGLFYLRREIMRRRGWWSDEGAEKVIRNSKNFISESGQPFFLFMNFVEPHAPYRPPKGYVRRFVDEDVTLEEMNRAIEKSFIGATAGEVEILRDEREILKSLHDAELRYLDDKVKELVTHLETEGIADETVIAIFSDHGDLWGEDGVWGHQAKIHEKLCNVPLVISYPWETKTSNSEVVQLSNLHDHFQELALEKQTELTGGEALVEYYGWDTQLSIKPWEEYENIDRDQYEAYQGVIVKDGYRLYWDATDKVGLYDTKNNEEVSKSNSEVVERLQREIEERVGTPKQNHKRYREQESGTEIENEELKQHLEDLGYF